MGSFGDLVMELGDQVWAEAEETGQDHREVAQELMRPKSRG